MLLPLLAVTKIELKVIQMAACPLRLPCGIRSFIPTSGCRVSESVSRPLLNFGVLNENLIKCLISCIKCISRFLIKVQMYSLIHHLKCNYEVNETIVSY
jgi:hypothetical protein